MKAREVGRLPCEEDRRNEEKKIKATSEERDLTEQRSPAECEMEKRHAEDVIDFEKFPYLLRLN